MAGKKTDSPEIDVQQPSEIFDKVYIPDPVEIEIIPGTSHGVKGKGGLSVHAQELLFNEEIIEVMVHESTDENAENPIFVGCNGVAQYFYRGVPQEVRRKFVAILASCKEHGITTPEVMSPDGSKTMSIRRTSSLKYPFSVISDPNPRGADWLRSMLRAPT